MCWPTASPTAPEVAVRTLVLGTGRLPVHCGVVAGPRVLLGHLLEHPPQPLRLVLISRRDPPLPLVSLRAAHRIAEVTLGDLRFASPEMAEFLEATAGHAASDSALANLQHEVEGWGGRPSASVAGPQKREGPGGLLERPSRRASANARLSSRRGAQRAAVCGSGNAAEVFDSQPLLRRHPRRYLPVGVRNRKLRS